MAFEDLHRPLSAAGFRGAIKWILIISGLMLLAQQFAGSFLLYYLGLTPVLVLHRYWVWQVVTYMFLHGGFFHWFFNMFILWMFGRELEVRWGTLTFLKYFFVTGIGAAACVLLLSPRSIVPTMGASGAVFGVLVAFAMVFPEAVIYLYFLIPVKAWQAALLFAVIELFAGLEGGGAGIARFAHLGGMLTGYIYIRYGWEWKISFKRFFPIRRRPVEFHELSDDLAKEVDSILDKILKKGVNSLSKREKEIMERYSSLKH
jgi:membrane associated rhomboid family serine protease